MKKGLGRGLSSLFGDYGDLELTAKFEKVQEEQPGEPEAPSDKSEEKSGCGNAASILFLSFALLGLCIIKKKQ